MSDLPSASAGAEASPATALPRHLILFIGALVAIGPLSLDAYLPAMPAMAEAFGVGIVSLNNTISIYLVGYGLGQFFGGAFSDQIGRKRIGLIGLAIFAVASVLIAMASTVEQVQWLRFTQAIGGGFATVICMAIVRDVYPVEELGKRMAMVTLVMLASPVIAPSIGAFLLNFGWPSIFVFKAVYACVLALYYLAFIPETQPGSWSKLSVLTTLRQCKDVVTRKSETGQRPVFFALCMGLAASVFMTFLTNSSFVYIEYFGVSESRFPIYFGVSILGLVATNIYSMNRLTQAKAPVFFRLGLRIQFLAVVALALVVFFLAPSAWLVVAAVAVMVATFGLTGPAGSSQYMSHFSKLAGSASSFYTTLMFAMGAIFGSISGYFFDGSLRPMVVTMLVAALAANLMYFGIKKPAIAARQ
jgi:DHA1 family bicyclomycin/chloramphenicol resistance-like MFS transporter